MEFVYQPFLSLTISEILVIAISELYFLVGYLLIRTVCPSKKSQSWILSLQSSSVLAASGIYYAYLQWVHLSNNLPIEDLVYSESQLSRSICYFFQVFLVNDIIIGCIDYFDQLQLFSGWIHHLLYFNILSYLLYHGYATGICMFFSLEIPTVIIALGRVFSGMRQDLLFGGTFFTFRILYHGYMLARFLVFREGSARLWPLVLMAWGVHWQWFYSWVKLMTKPKGKEQGDNIEKVEMDSNGRRKKSNEKSN